MFRDQWLENNKVKFGLITRDNFRTPSFYAYQKIIMDNNAFCSLIDGFNHAGTGYNKNIWTLKGKAAADKNDTLTLMQDSVLQTYRFAPMPKDKILYQDIIINIPVRKTASPVTVTLGGKLPEQQLKIMFSGKNSVVMKCGQQELFHDRLPINRGDIEIKLQLSRKSITGSIFTNNEKDSVAFDLKTDILNGVKACGASISAGSGTVILKDFVLTDKVLPKAADFGKF